MKRKAKNLVIALLFLLIGFYGFAVIIDDTFDPRCMRTDTIKGTFVTWLMVSTCITVSTFTPKN